MLYREIIAVCSQNHTKYINTLCGQNVEFLRAPTKLRKTTITYVMYARLYTRAHGTARLPPDGFSWYLIFIGPSIVNRMSKQDATVFSLLHFCRQLYMFRVLTPIIRSSHNCNYSYWHWSAGSATVRSRCWVGTQQRERMAVDPVNQYQKL